MKSQQVLYRPGTATSYYHFSSKEILEEHRDKLLKEYHTAIKNGRVFKNVKKLYLKIKTIKQNLQELEIKEKAVGCANT